MAEIFFTDGLNHTLLDFELSKQAFFDKND